MIEMKHDLVTSLGLGWRLFIRDVSAQYRQSILGYLWILIPPLVASLPFVYLNAQGVVKIGDTPIPYGAYAILGTTIWQAFADALAAPLRAATAARGTLIRINLPREAILLSALAQVGLGVLARLLLLIGVFAWFRLVPAPTVVFFPLGILSLILVGFVVGVFITPIALLYSDVQQALPLFTTSLMMLTPVLYPIPESGGFAAICMFNPLTPLIESTRDWLVTGASAHFGAFTIVTVSAMAFLILAWIVFRVAMPHLIARIGN